MGQLLLLLMAAWLVLAPLQQLLAVPVLLLSGTCQQ
jgi:hypothetical protein